MKARGRLRQGRKIEKRDEFGDDMVRVQELKREKLKGVELKDAD